VTDLFAVANDGAAIRKGLVHEAHAKNKRSHGHCHENGLKHSDFPIPHLHVNVTILSLNARNCKGRSVDARYLRHGRALSAALELAASPASIGT
jgi:hypothetical protein